MKTEKVDRRVRKTKARLTEVLLTLMKEKEVKDISVKELSDLADINRGTFTCITGTFTTLDSVEDELFCQFSEILNRDFTAIQEDSLYSVLEDVFSFLYENMQAGQVLMGAHGDLAFINRMKGLVKERILQVWNRSSQPSQAFDYYYSFLVSGCIGLIEAWLNKDAPEPPKQIAALAGDMIKRGLVTPIF
ncbi:MAG: TetR-like C-terminal domain-containing protein [Eisenbergiella massiliensis]